MLLLLVVAVVLVVGAVMLGAVFFTDYLWFANLGLDSVLWTQLGWQWAIRLGAGASFALVVFLNLLVARPSVRRLQAVDADADEQGVAAKLILGRWLVPALAVVSLVFGFLYSTGIGDVWQDVLLFLRGGTFGQTDPIFHRDIGFYMFSLPFYQALYGSVQGVVWTSLLISGILYLVTGAVSFADGRLGVSTRAKAHLSVLLAVLFGLKAWGYLLSMYGLVYSPRGVVFGASYSDVYALIPGLKILAVIAVVAALTLLVGIFRPGIRLTIASVVLLLIASPLAGTIYPGLVQRFVVEPNELVKESPFIEHNIALTRQAFGLDEVVRTEFPAQAQLTYDDLAQSPETVSNIRLWDWRPLLQVYSQLQEMRLYYEFREVDVDRYQLDGQYRQVMLAAREMNPQRIQNQSWINQRLQYTHGYGAVVSPVDVVTTEGTPSFWVRDVPPVAQFDELEMNRPEIYYGELTNDYVVVNSRTPEFDYPKGSENAQVRYQGRGGVALSNLLTRLAFAVRMGEPKLLISSELSGESRIMFNRDVVGRAARIAPFFRYENDPYLVISQGKLYWLLDAYTTSGAYPFATPVRGWGNYVRNSVKVVIDAYDGRVQFFLADPTDPMAVAYQKIFPGLLRDIDEMDPGLRQHLRYPEGLFSVQASVYASYHMNNPTVFYNQEDLWSIPQEILGASPVTMDPYYIIMRLPGSDKPEMILMQPFTPARKNNMVAWMAARMDGDNYGQLLLYSFPKSQLTYGPMQIEARIDQDAEISQLLTLWSQQGSNVSRGNLLVIPIGDSVLYVEPIYLQAAQSRMPELKRVVVGNGASLAMGTTLDEALERLFGAESAKSTPERRLDGAVPEEVTEYKGLVAAAVDAYERAQARLRDGDWAGYGSAMEALESALRGLQQFEEQAELTGQNI